MSVTIQAATIPNWQRDGDVVLRIYATTSFVAQDGTLIVAGDQSDGLSTNNNFFQSVDCTLSGTTLSIPQVVLPPTTDSPDNPNAKWCAFFFTAEGDLIGPYGQFASFHLTPTPSSTTWASIAASGGTGAIGSQAPAYFFAGAWITGKPYGQSNVVTNANSLWIALRPNVSVTPVVGDDWALMIQNTQGPQGIPGPTGTSGVQLPFYESVAAALEVAAAGSYFLVSSGSSDGGYLSYRNNSGVAVLDTTLSGPTAQSNGKLLTVGSLDYDIDLYDLDGNGKPYSVLYENRVADLETDVATLQTTVTSSPAVAGGPALLSLESTDYSLPIIASDGTLAVPSKEANAGGSYLLSLECQDFSLPIVNADGSLALPLPSASLPSSLSVAIAAVDAAAQTYSRSVADKVNLIGSGLVYDYNVVILDGQSMTSGYQAIGLYSTSAKHGNLGLGQQARIVGGGSSGPPGSVGGFGEPIGDANLDPLVEGGAESPTSGAANMLKNYLNSMTLTAENGKKLVFVNIASPGTPIEQHLPTSTQTDDSGKNLWSRVQTVMADLFAAIPSGKTMGIVAVCWGQGEFNVGNTAAGYTANLVTLRAAYDALIASTFSQTTPATWFISQIGGGYISDASPGVIHAEINYPLQTPHTYGISSYYHIPNIANGHRTGNGFRWLGTQWGRIMGQVLAQRKSFEPLRPISAKWVGNTLLLGFHVPVGPLTTRPSYFNAAPQNFSDLGFSLYDATGYVQCAVSIVAGAVVQLVPTRTVDQATAKVIYAGSGLGVGDPAHLGMGNLFDSNNSECENIYAAPDQDSVAAGNNSATNGAPAGTNYDIAGLTGLPYPQNNPCVAFQLTTSTFAGTF